MRCGVTGHLLKYVQRYQARNIAFNRPEDETEYLDLVLLHTKQKALRKLIRALREILKEKGKYVGSLLEQMDKYDVKLTELSGKPIVLRPGIDVQRPVLAAVTKTRPAGKRQTKANKKYK
jgi:hypothetical protein